MKKLTKIQPNKKNFDPPNKIKGEFVVNTKAQSQPQDNPLKKLSSR